MTSNGSDNCHSMKCVKETDVKTYRPTDLLDINCGLNCCLILLNGQANCPCIDNHIDRIWNRSTYRVCADGAANRLYHHNTLHKSQFVPTAICGDLDSINDITGEHFKQKNVEIHRSADQDSTDFTKCIEFAKAKGWIAEVDKIVVLGGFCGRFDHVMGCVQTLHLAKSQIGVQIPVYLLHNESLTFLLPRGHSIVYNEFAFITQQCGLVPVGCVANDVSTTGLKWNLKNQKMMFGGLISTSNEIETSRIDIWSDEILLMIIEVKSIDASS